VTRELLDPSYAMFIPDEETRSLWFNPHSLEVCHLVVRRSPLHNDE
jgi:hypothetical protein